MWIESLRTSFSQSRYSVVQSLLRDFGSIKEEEYNEELVTEGLQLLFDILKTSKVSDAEQVPSRSSPWHPPRAWTPAARLRGAGARPGGQSAREDQAASRASLCSAPQNDAVTQQLAAIFTHCYGSSPVPSIPEIQRTLPARLGARPPAASPASLPRLGLPLPAPRAAALPQCLRSSPRCPPASRNASLAPGGPSVTSLLSPRAQILTF